MYRQPTYYNQVECQPWTVDAVLHHTRIDATFTFAQRRKGQSVNSSAIVVATHGILVVVDTDIGWIEPLNSDTYLWIGTNQKGL
jgi:hypothetical protein